MSLAADAERKGDDVEVRALHARAGDSEATGSGRLHLGEPLRFAADLKLARFNPARFGDYPEGSINGSLQAKGDLGGRGSARWEIAGQPPVRPDAWQVAAPRASRENESPTRMPGRRSAQNRATAKGSFGGPQRPRGVDAARTRSRGARSGLRRRDPRQRHSDRHVEAAERGAGRAGDDAAPRRGARFRARYRRKLRERWRSHEGDITARNERPGFNSNASRRMARRTPGAARSCRSRTRAPIRSS